MLEVETPLDLLPYVDKVIGVSDWLTITQQRIDDFARTTGDDQWIHVDVERVAREVPGGKTIAHGYLLLSLVPILTRDIYKIRARKRGLNYGLNKLRFMAPVPVGSQVRIQLALKAVEETKGGYQIWLEATMEIEGQARPAMVAELIFLVFT